MSLQTLTRSPFRVVDEINQGMDMRNERLVHARMVRIATGNDDMRFAVQGVDASAVTAHVADGNADSENEDEDLYGDGSGHLQGMARRRGISEKGRSTSS